MSQYTKNTNCSYNRTANVCRNLLDVYGTLHPESIELSIVHEGDLAADLGKTLFFDNCGVLNTIS